MVELGINTLTTVHVTDTAMSVQYLYANDGCILRQCQMLCAILTSSGFVKKQKRITLQTIFYADLL